MTCEQGTDTVHDSRYERCLSPVRIRISLEKMKKWVEKHPNPSTDKLRTVYLRFMALQAMYFECVESKIDSTRFYFKKAYDIVNTMDHPFEYDRVRTRLNFLASAVSNKIMQVQYPITKRLYSNSRTSQTLWRSQPYIWG